MNGFEYTENAKADEAKVGHKTANPKTATRAAAIAISYNYEPMQIALYAVDLEIREGYWQRLYNNALPHAEKAETLQAWREKAINLYPDLERLE